MVIGNFIKVIKVKRILSVYTLLCLGCAVICGSEKDVH
jgi:hypothetical protein